MSADVWIETPPCDKCGRTATEGPESELNVTYNLTPMLREAGFIGWGSLIGMTAARAGEHVLGILNGMADNPEKWRAKNPANGWGSFDGCLQTRMRKWAEGCLQAPKGSVIGGSL